MNSEMNEIHMPKIPQFTNSQLLATALTHRSALNERISPSAESYERLEFLGDAVLELCTTKFLYQILPDEPEGVMTAYRSALVKTGTLATLAKEMGLGEKMYMSKGEEATGGRSNQSLLADVFEAVIGAFYLDQGFDAVYQFLETSLFPKFEYIKEHGLYRDYKSTLQELVQSRGLPTPTYTVLAEEGPDHEKTFTIGVLIDGEIFCQSSGTSKQRAEQATARLALEKLEKK